MLFSFEEKVMIQLKRNRDGGLTPKTKKELSSILNLSRAYVDEVIKGTQNGPKARQYKLKIARILGIDTEE